MVIVCVLAAAAACSSSKPNTEGVGGLGTATGSPLVNPSGSASSAGSGASGGSSGSGGSGGSGSGTTSGKSTKKPSNPTSDWPTPQDCVSYNPSSLTVNGDATGGTFTVSDGSTVVIRVHGQDNVVGQQALALAQRYTKHCYLGRNNSRDPQADYIMDYWRNPSGKTPTIPDPDDNLCSPYNNHNLTVENMGDGQGWRVKDHDHVLHVFDNQTDARNGDLVLSKYSQACSIGFSDDTDSDKGAVTYFR